MNILFLDIETLPADTSHEDTSKALRFLFDKKLEKKAKRKELSENVVFEIEPRPDVKPKSDEQQFEDYIRGTSFDGSFGRVLCICLAVNDDPVQTYIYPSSEKKILENFWKVAGQCDLFVGHNVMDFDLRFIIQRSIICGVKPSWHFDRDAAPKNRYLSFARYCNRPIFDTMHEWVKWSRDSIGLEHIALALGLPTPKDGIDGSKVWDFFKEGKVKEIGEYCVRDVETTRAVYKKMVYKDKLS